MLDTLLKKKNQHFERFHEITPIPKDQKYINYYTFSNKKTKTAEWTSVHNWLYHVSLCQRDDRQNQAWYRKADSLDFSTWFETWQRHIGGGFYLIMWRPIPHQFLKMSITFPIHVPWRASNSSPVLLAFLIINYVSCRFVTLQTLRSLVVP